MANYHRGEVDICLSGAPYTLRPTFQALCELEQRAECSIYVLARRMEEGAFTLHDITCIIWSGIRGTLGEKTPAIEDIGECIVRDGLANYIPPAYGYIAGALGIETATIHESR